MFKNITARESLKKIFCHVNIVIKMFGQKNIVGE